MAEDILWSGSESATAPPTGSKWQRVPSKAALVGAGIAVVVAGGAFYAGHTTAPTGPATLAAAVTQAQQGELPCGQGNRLVTALCDANGNGGFPAGGPGGRSPPPVRW